MEKAEILSKQINDLRNRIIALVPAITPEAKAAIKLLRKEQIILLKELKKEESPTELFSKSVQVRCLVREISILVKTNEDTYSTYLGVPIDPADIYRQLHYLSVKAKEWEKYFRRADSRLKGLETQKKALRSS